MSNDEATLRTLLQERAEGFHPYAGLPAGLLGRTRRAMAAAAMVVTIAAAAVGFGLVGTLRWLNNRTVPLIVPPHPVPTSPRPIAETNGVATLLRLEGPAFSVVAGPDAVYASYTTDQAGDRGRIVRLDLGGRAVVRSRLFRGSIWLERAGGWLWATAAGASGPEIRHLYQLDPTTLAVVRTTDVSVVKFRDAPGQLVVTPFGLWVANGPNIVLVDPSDGTVLQAVTATADGEVGSLAADPTGSILYVSTHLSGELTALDLSERDAATGRLRVAVPLRNILAVSGLSATNRGVWVSSPTGLLGSVVFDRAKDLKTIHGVPGTNGIHGVAAQGMLWVLDDMIGKLSCADDSTGKVLATVKLARLGQQSWGFSGSVGAAGGRVYLGAGKAVVRITPEATCRS